MTSGGDFPLEPEFADEHGAQAAQQFASQLIRGLSDGELLDAEAIIRAHPSLMRFKSVVMDLAYEEYCRRHEAGESIDRESFARRFPDYRLSLLRLLEVHSAFDRGDLLKSVDVQWPVPGQTFLGFELREELGRGAFSHVYAATEPKVNGRRVVVKVCVHGDYEVNALAELQHDNIVPVFSVERAEEQSLTAICMPYLGKVTLYDVLDHAYGRQQRPPSSGRTIFEALERYNAASRESNGKQGRPPEALWRESFVDMAAGFGAQLAAALDYTHRRGLCHGDIKPSNVLITPEGKAMLFDFNLAFAGGDQNRIGGTLPYMAPEQLQATLNVDAQDAKVDNRSDIFSLGAMLYEVLTGELPFGPMPEKCDDRRELAQQLLALQQAGPRPIQQKNPYIDRKLAWTIQRCLAFDPAARFQSAGALVQALRARKSGGMLQRLGISRRQAVLGGGAAVAIALALATARAFWPIGPAEQARQAFAEGDYDKVIVLLESLSPEELDNELRTLLAVAYMRRKSNGDRKTKSIDDYVKAAALLETVSRSNDTNAAVDACLAVCKAHAYIRELTFEDRHHLVELLRSAIAEMGSTPELENDLAYCLQDIGEVDEARARLRAVAAGEEVSTLTRAAAQLNLAAIERKYSINEQRQPDFEAFKEARRLGIETRELHLVGVWLYANAGARAQDMESRQSNVDAALHHLYIAARLGACQDELDSPGDLLPELREDAKLRIYMRSAPSQPETIPTGRLVDPLGGDDSLLENRGR